MTACVHRYELFHSADRCFSKTMLMTNAVIFKIIDNVYLLIHLFLMQTHSTPSAFGLQTCRPSIHPTHHKVNVVNSMSCMVVVNI